MLNINCLFFIIIYSFIFLLSIVGNLILLLTISRRKRMRTVPNYFLANIIVSNIMYTLCAPFPFILELQQNNNEWIYFDFLCPIIPMVNTISINLNTITMIVASIDRLIAIICPFRTRLRKSQCFYIILIIWLISILFSLPWSYLFTITEYSLNDQFESTNRLCDIRDIDLRHWIKFYLLSLCVIQYLLPLIVLCLTISIIAYYMNVTNANSMILDENKSNRNLRKKNENRVTF